MRVRDWGIVGLEGERGKYTSEGLRKREGSKAVSEGFRKREAGMRDCEIEGEIGKYTTEGKRGNAGEGVRDWVRKMQGN
jgi:hypothetical protein